MLTKGSGRQPTVDVVVPVYGGLRHVRSCLDALRRWTTDVDHHLIVVDDASDEHTRRTVGDLVEEGWGERGTMLVNDRNLGFLQTANRGMRESTAEVVALLNSDTLVAPGWLASLVACLTSSPEVGVVSPVSNYSLLTRIDAVYGTHHLRVAEAVRRVSPHHYPDIGMATGMCLVAWRSLLDELDYFDEEYGRGYFEEADLCMRAAERGWRILADDATYVHHHGWGSFGTDGRNEIVERNRALFQQRWGDAHEQAKRRVRRAQPYAELERRLRIALQDRAQVSPRRSLPRSGSRNVAEKARRGHDDPDWRQAVPTAARHSLEHWQAVAKAERAVPADADDVLILVDDLTVTPWTTDVLQLVDRLVRDDVAAALATSGPFDPALFSDPSRVRPYVLSGPDELLDVVGAHRVVIATSPATVFDALLLRQRDGSRVATWFEPQAVGAALGWPQEGWATALAPTFAHAHLGPAVPAPVPGRAPVHQVPVGVDTDVYAPGHSTPHPPRVLIPHSLRTGPEVTTQTQAAAASLCDLGFEVTLYGDPVPTDDTTAVPMAPQSVEAQLLTEHAVVLEVGPVPGMERLRLRTAATATPLVLASPTAASCRLCVGTDAFGAPRGDVDRAVALTASLLRHEVDSRDRLASGRRQAQAVSIDAEATALGDAVAAIAERH